MHRLAAVGGQRKLPSIYSSITVNFEKKFTIIDVKIDGNFCLKKSADAVGGCLSVISLL